MIRQSLHQKMLQKLSPQQIQLMKLLQIPTAVLEQRIKEELEANPALEESDNPGDFEANESQDEPLSLNEEDETSNTEFEDDGSLGGEDTSMGADDYINDYLENDETYGMDGGYSSSDEQEKSIPAAVENSFHEFLERQLGLLNLEEERQESIALQIIGSIDDDGYLRREPSAIVDDLMFSQNIFTSEQEILLMLSKIQKFDPPGIGARSLQECLLLQLQYQLDQKEELETIRKSQKVAYTIIEKYFEEFSKKHYEKLQKALGISEEDLKAAVDEILKLNPKPASGYSGNTSANQYVIPDFIVENKDGELELMLNTKNAPDLRISDQYKDMLRHYKRTIKGRRATSREKEAVLFIKNKIDSAKWFIDAIKQRQHTLYQTMFAIMQYQYDYFLSGDTRKLRPMILKDVADITGLDISTISRVANSKFVQTEFGAKRLKEFFSESMQTTEGEEVSTLEIKKILNDLVGAESKKKPLSDEKLTSLLQEKGYNIARRTVAKYREQLNIPVARLRKEL